MPDVNKKTEPREFWIDLRFDPNPHPYDSFWKKTGVANADTNVEWAIHVIEYSAYEAIKIELEGCNNTRERYFAELKLTQSKLKDARAELRSLRSELKYCYARIDAIGNALLGLVNNLGQPTGEK